MTMQDITVCATSDLVAFEAARRLASLFDAEDDGQREWHLAVSGGSFATSVFPRLVEVVAERTGLASRVHIWFADERWLPHGVAERNSTPIAAALEELSGFHADKQLHLLVSSDSGPTLEEACRSYADELAEATDALDLVLLSAGPDGHTASLFPGKPGHDAAPRGTISVTDSPKPPSERMSLTLAEIRGAQRVWAVVTGAGKAEAVALAVRSDDATATPLGAAKGVLETVLMLDEPAAAAIS